MRVIELCQLLQDTVGLARVSYTEFSACRIALLALIAHSLQDSTSRIANALSQGMGLIRQMCVGLESARSEVAVIEALERARQRLSNNVSTGQNASAWSATGYDQFNEWARIWRDPSARSGIDVTDVNRSVEGQSRHFEFPVEEPSHHSVPSFDGFFSSFPDELCEFATIPGLNGELTQDWMDVSHLEDPQWSMS
jgi:hypothetical protein